jgi:hypothetical protein
VGDDAGADAGMVQLQDLHMYGRARDTSCACFFTPLLLGAAGYVVLTMAEYGSHTLSITEEGSVSHSTVESCSQKCTCRVLLQHKHLDCTGLKAMVPTSHAPGILPACMLSEGQGHAVHL